MKNLLALFLKKHFLFLVFLFSSFSSCFSQSLFSDSALASVKVWIGADSLEWLYSNPVSNQYLKADMVYENGLVSDTMRNIGFRLRGNTSRFSKKKSFKISFNTFLPGRRYQGVKKLNLNGQHNDPTMVREKFFYQLWNKAGMPARRTVFVKLYVNNRYMGLYTALEEMDKDWLQRTMGNNAGNLYKCTYPADLVYLGPDQDAYKAVQTSAVTGGRAYSLETNEAEDDYAGLVQLCARLKDPVTASFPQNIEAILDVDVFLKALALEISCGHWDDYAFNKNNYFLYQNPGTGRFHFISYDADNTFGVDWSGINWSTRTLSKWINPSQSRPLVTKILSYQPYYQRFLQITDSINRHIINPDSCFSWLDWAQSHIQAAAAADSFRTLDYGYSLQDFNAGFTEAVDNHTPIGIKPFLQNRFGATQNQLNILGVQSSQGSGTRPPYPNPFRNHVLVPFPEQDLDVLRLVDFSGREIEARYRNAGHNTLLFDFGLLPKGIYRLTIFNKQGEMTSYSLSSE